MQWPEGVTEQSVINGCLEGDRKAQALLFNLYYDRITGLVYRILGPTPDLDDIVQALFIQVFKSLGQYKGQGILDGWIYRITVNICREQIRQKQRVRQLKKASDSESILERTADSEAGALEKLKDNERTQEIFSALDKLTWEKRVVVVMHDMDGRTLEEIAETVKAPLGTVKSRLFHARNELQKRLKIVFTRE